MSRTFDDSEAVRKSVPVLVGLVGPSGSGKTYTALRLAAGMRAASGKETFVIDTEANRALHYADRFAFRHVPFSAPFGSLDYLAAIEHCVKRGAGQIIVDSQSHEHEGPGGVLEAHEKELDRLAGNDFKKRERMTFLAWAKPKAERRRLINTILQINCNFIFCFRAKEKMKIVAGKEPVHLGFQPIAGEEFVYEMTLNLFLPPRSNGVPDLSPAEVGERMMLKIPAQFQALLAPGRVLDEEVGKALASWAAGEAPGQPSVGQAQALQAQILAVLRDYIPGDARKDSSVAAQRSAALLSAFGNGSWKAVQAMGLDALQVGFAALTANLEGLAAMRREPGEDPGTEPELWEGQPCE